MKRDRNPRMITLKYNATCAETGMPLRSGDVAVYYPTSPKGANLFHPDSKTAEGFRMAEADRAMGHDY